ncbi:hypothetical protein FACS1894219_05340 [Clostridia bacterium]|nr:hypothetical protein FACS1894219_05340 [Clostridia bacterium]
MITLGIDTTQKTAAVCVYADGIYYETQSEDGISHSESLIALVDQTLHDAGITIQSVGRFAVSVGPGSFTGVRIGVSAVKGFAFGNESANCIPVSSLLALAYGAGARDGAIVIPTIDARRTQVYTAIFEMQSGIPVRLTEDCIMLTADLMEKLANEYPGREVVFNSTVSGKSVCRATADAAAVTARELSPRYVIAPEAERNLAENKQSCIY